MFFPAEKLLDVAKCVLKADEESRALIRHTFPREPGTGPTTDEIIAFIKRLPPPAEQEKITNKVIKLAEAVGFTADNCRWWSISPNEHWYFVTVHRDNRHIETCFIWQNVEKGKKSSIPPNWQGGAWARDMETEERWRFQFQCVEYHDVIKLYEAWLKCPLPPTPDQIREAQNSPPPPSRT